MLAPKSPWATKELKRRQKLMGVDNEHLQYLPYNVTVGLIVPQGKTQTFVADINKFEELSVDNLVKCLADIESRIKDQIPMDEHLRGLVDEFHENS